MRRLLLAGLTVSSLTGIAYAQQALPEVWVTPVQSVPRRFSPQCERMDDKKKYDVNAVVEKDGVSFRCETLYDEWLSPTSRVGWVKADRR